MRKSRAQAIEQQGSDGDKETLKLPHDPVGEAAIIASVIVSAEARRRYLSLPADLFVAQGHAEAWAALQQTFERGLTYDPVTIRQLTGGRVDPNVLDGYVAVRPELPPNLASFVDRLRWDATRVAAAKDQVPALLEALRDMSADPDRVRSLAKDVAKAFDGAGSGRLRRSTAAILNDARASLSKRREGQASYPYGFPGLDFYGPGDLSETRRGEQRDLNGTPRLIPGAGPGMATVVTGASGSGKTTSVAGMVLAWARREERTLWGAWEVKDHMNLELLAVLSLGWSRSDVMTGQYTSEEQAELLAEMERLARFVSFLDLPFDRKKSERGASNDRNLDVLQQEVSDVAPDHFVADLFQRCLVQTKPDEEARAAYRFQAMMQEERCHGVLVHQLRLKGDDFNSRPDQRPSLAQLKGSTGYVEAADTVLAWYRPAFYKSVPDDKIECHVLKQRYGKYPQAVELDWDPEYGVVENGHTIEVERPGEQAAADNFLDEALRAPSKGRGKRRRL